MDINDTINFLKALLSNTLDQDAIENLLKDFNYNELISIIVALTTSKEHPINENMRPILTNSFNVTSRNNKIEFWTLAGKDFAFNQSNIPWKALHRSDGPAIRVYCADKVIEEYYYIDGKRHNEKGPALIYKNSKGDIIFQQYFLDDVLYDDFEWIEKTRNIQNCVKDNTSTIEYWTNEFPGCFTIAHLDIALIPYNKLHRINRPAFIMRINGNIISEGYYKNGLLHREDGPAKLYLDSNDNKLREEYYLNGKRLNQMQWLNQINPLNPKYQYKYWTKDGQFVALDSKILPWHLLHREEGAALISYSEYGDIEEEYYLNGIKYSKEDWEKEINKPKYTYECWTKEGKYSGEWTDKIIINWNELHREGGLPAFVKYGKNNIILHEEYRENGLLHRLNDAAFIKYNEFTLKRIEHTFNLYGTRYSWSIFWRKCNE